MSAPDLTLHCCACDAQRPWDPFEHRCPRCGEALELRPAVSAVSTEELGAPMPTTGSAEGMWRYGALLPEIDRELVAARVFMGEGGTPLLRARAVERALGCGEVWLKDESRNPTGSFKDRGTAVGVALLAQLGFDAVGTVSTGNMARSVAAYAARASMRSSIWVGASTPPHKLAPVAVHGAALERFEAPYGEIYAASMEWSRRSGVPFINSDSALRVEGQKTIGWEIAEQLGGRAPDWVLVPTSSGGNLSAIARGFAEAAALGLLEGVCRLVAVQSAECDPIVRGFDAGGEQPVEVPSPTTIAGAISNPTPPSGARALRWLRRTGGLAVAVADADIAAAQLTLARLTGRFVQPASAAPLAALERLLADGTVQTGDRVVLLLTGAGGNAPAPEIDIDPPRPLSEAFRGLDNGTPPPGGQ